MALENRSLNTTAVLGPTNTGKTHLAIERMLGHSSGMIGLPLRLLAREVYDKIAARVGEHNVALITGEEKIRPELARYYVCTVEAMPREIDVDFLAIDEVQLAADPERGHVFTDRLLHARGRSETLLLGAQTMRDAVADLIPGANFVSRPRLSKLTYSGEKKITRLPQRSAIVAFSASEVYAIAELIRRQRGGAAVVLGALSPRTRNAQVALYQNGDVEYIVATDAIGMGLNLDVDHVAFAGIRKFDGQSHRVLQPGEIAQIAGRAGRHMNDGTFGVTGTVDAFDAELVERLETHNFEPIKLLQWRNSSLSFASIDALYDSLRVLPREARLTRARTADDMLALENVSRDSVIRDRAKSTDVVSLLWDVCQVPDYRKISSNNHAELVSTLFKSLTSGEGHLDEDWYAKQVAMCDRTDGDIDTLANRLAHIRTWTFVANRPSWLKDAGHWQGRTRQIEDNLSDALHECLAQRFVDRRTSALMRGMRDKSEMQAEITSEGAINVENHYVGRLHGFRFYPDTQSGDVHGKAARSAAAHVLSTELTMRARRVSSAKNEAFSLQRDGALLWQEQEIARLEPGETTLKPELTLLADEHLTPPDKERVKARLDKWLGDTIADKLKPLVELSNATEITGLARGIAFRLTDGCMALRRDEIADDLKSLDQEARAQLRKYGVRFGAFNIFIPVLLKPAAADLALTLWLLKHGREHGIERAALPEPPKAGLTSMAVSPGVPEIFFRAAGYHSCGPRIVRMDMLERLADLIRPLLAWRPSETAHEPPKGSTGDGGFRAIPEMMSILGTTAEELGKVLQALGFRCERRPVRAAAPSEPVVQDQGASPAASEQTPPHGVADAVEPDAGEAQGAAVPTVPETSNGTVDGEGLTPHVGSGAGLAVSGGAELSPPAAEGHAVVAPGAADAVSDDAVPASPAASAHEPVKEPVLEEIWRPRRRHEQQNRPRRRRPRSDEPRVAPQAQAGAVAGQQAGGETDAEKTDARKPWKANKSRGDRNRDERQGKTDRPSGGRPSHGGPRNDKAKRHGGDRDRERGQRARMVSVGPAKSEAQEASSPFAALSALKKELEKRS